MGLRFPKSLFYPPRDCFIGATNQHISKFGGSPVFWAGIVFKLNSEWDKYAEDFQIDTGAFISYAPQSIKNRYNIHTEFKLEVNGISENKDCAVITEVGFVPFKFLLDDGESLSDEFHAWFAFHPYKESKFFSIRSIIDKNLSINYDPPSGTLNFHDSTNKH